MAEHLFTRINRSAKEAAPKTIGIARKWPRRGNGEGLTVATYKVTCRRQFVYPLFSYICLLTCYSGIYTGKSGKYDFNEGKVSRSVSRHQFKLVKYSPPEPPMTNMA